MWKAIAGRYSDVDAGTGEHIPLLIFEGRERFTIEAAEQDLQDYTSNPNSSFHFAFIQWVPLVGIGGQEGETPPPVVIAEPVVEQALPSLPEGWTRWYGGGIDRNWRMPSDVLPPTETIEVMLGSGRTLQGQTSRWRWTWRYDGGPDDIVAYRRLN